MCKCVRGKGNEGGVLKKERRGEGRVNAQGLK
jgi:hypothetical protein